MFSRRHAWKQAAAHVVESARLAQVSFALDEPTLPHLFETSLIRVNRPAMATRFEIALPYGTPDAIAAASSALDLIEEVEDILTIYRDDSETSRLTQRAVGAAIVVSPMLAELLEQCVPLVHQSEGAFDPASGTLVKAWGFYRRQGRVPSDAELAQARQAAGFKHVQFDIHRRTVKFLRPGVEFNFGSIGKGFALDCAARHLQQVWGIQVALLHGGGSSAYGIGAPVEMPRGWPIRLTHPDDRERTLGQIFLNNRGLGVSAATYQHFIYNGKKYGHVIDPRLGTPAAGVACAAMLAPTAASADALSTAAFVLGRERAKRVVETAPGRELLLLPEGSDETIYYNSDARLADYGYN